MTTEIFKFGIVDFAVLGVILFASAAIGIYYQVIAGKQQTTQDYLMANNNMPNVPVAVSLVTSFMSSVAMLGIPRELYMNGTEFVLIYVGFFLGCLLVSYFYLPVFFDLQSVSAYQYLEQRFGRPTRLMASGLFICQMVLYTSVVLYTPAVALNAVTGISIWVSILSVGLVCTFYSTIGGMKAVVWGNVFQSCLMFVTIFAVIIKGVLDYQGLHEIWNIAVIGKRIKFFDFTSDLTARSTFWTQVVGGMFIYLTLYGVNQTQVQRLLTISNLKHSQLTLMYGYLVVALLGVSISFSGLVIYSKYSTCDPITSERIQSSDQLLPIFIMDCFASYPGLAGLLVSGIFSATLGMFSSAVNSLSAATFEDFIKPVLKGRVENDTTYTVITKILACIFGILCVALSFVVDKLGFVLDITFQIVGIIGGPMLGLFSLGMFCPRSTQRVAVTSFIIGIVFGAWMGFGATLQQPVNPALPTSVVGCSGKKNDAVFSSANVSLNNATEDSVRLEKIVNKHGFPNATFVFDDKLVPDLQEENKSIFYLYRISYMWYAPFGFLMVTVLGVICSLCEEKRSIDLKLLSPVCRRRHQNISDTDSEFFQLLPSVGKDNKKNSYPLLE